MRKIFGSLMWNLLAEFGSFFGALFLLSIPVISKVRPSILGGGGNVAEAIVQLSRSNLFDVSISDKAQEN